MTKIIRVTRVKRLSVPNRIDGNMFSYNGRIPIVFYLITNWRTTTNNGNFYRIIILRVKNNSFHFDQNLKLI